MGSFRRYLLLIGGSMSKDVFNPTIIGISPLGNNQIEGTGPGETPITNTDEGPVPLVYDSITGTWCAELSRVNQEDRLVGLEIANVTMEDQRFLGQAGWINS